MNINSEIKSVSTVVSERFFIHCLISGLQSPASDSSLYSRGQAQSQSHHHRDTQEEGGGKPQQI
jgi:hypothetical protein